jgi:hypothetical protein
MGGDDPSDVKGGRQQSVDNGVLVIGLVLGVRVDDQASLLFVGESSCQGVLLSQPRR